MAKRKHLRLGFTVVAILLLFTLLNFRIPNEAVAQEVFRDYCGEEHWDYGSYKLVYDKGYLWGHYYDFSIATPAGMRPDVMGFHRVYVTWIRTSYVRAFKGLPF